MGDRKALLEEAQRALDMVDADARAALVAADDLLRRIPRQREPEVMVTAERAAALALKELGQFDAAERRLRSAIRRSESGAPRVAAEARMSLAFVLLAAGHARAALNAADRAALALDGIAAARLLAQRALILQRTGRTDEAMDAFSMALPVLRSAGDRRWEARLLNNRGLLHAYRGSLSLAENDLIRARDLWHDLSQDKERSLAEWNLGFVAAMKGDVLGALQSYERAERAFGAASSSYAALLLDKAHVLFSCGLAEEAATTAEEAIRALRVSGAGADVGEGLLVAAQANLARGATDRAATQASEAIRLLTAQARPGWALKARYVHLQATAAGGASAETLQSALKLGRQLAFARWREDELDVALLAARLATELGELGVAADQLKLARAARTHGGLRLRSRGWYAEALHRRRLGNNRGARRAIQAGLAAVRRQQSVVGATELRVHLSSLGHDLAELGLDIAIEKGSPPDIFSAAEVLRASSLALPPVRPPDDSELAGLMAELRVLTTAETNDQVEGLPRSRADLARRSELEARIRSLSRLARGATVTSTARRRSLADLIACLQEDAFVELFPHRAQWHAVTVVDGVARHHELPDTATMRLELESLRFAMGRAAAGMRSEVILESITRSARRLDEATLGRLPEIRGRQLVLSPGSMLHASPWAVLPTCRNTPLTVVPSAAVWLSTVTAEIVEGGDALLVAGPELPGGDAEVVQLAREIGPTARTLRGGDATAAAVLDAMATVSMAHIAAHGDLRTDNPMFSSLRLADGPLTVYDLERLPHVPPVVVLPACSSATGSVRAGEETLGLSSALLALGARTVIASVLPITDEETTDVMRTFHRERRQGRPPAQALATAVASGRKFSAAAFVCLGSG